MPLLKLAFCRPVLVLYVENPYLCLQNSENKFVCLSWPWPIGISMWSTRNVQLSNVKNNALLCWTDSIRFRITSTVSWSALQIEIYITLSDWPLLIKTKLTLSEGSIFSYLNPWFNKFAKPSRSQSILLCWNKDSIYLISISHPVIINFGKYFLCSDKIKNG